MFSKGVFDRTAYAEWLAPMMLVACLAGLHDVQAEAMGGRGSGRAANVAQPPSAVISNADPGVEVPPFVRPTEAIDWFRAKGTVTAEQFRRLDAVCKARAFSVARLSDDYALKVAQDSIGDAIEEGVDVNEWLTGLEGKFDAAGLTMDGSASYWRLVYDQNTTMAYGSMRYTQAQRVKKERPFWLFWNPAPVTPVCQSMAGQVYAADDPIWSSHYPPNHFRCKSEVVTLDADELADEGLEVSSSGNVPPVTTGFDFNPAEAFLLGKGSDLPPTPEGKAAMEALL